MRARLERNMNPEIQIELAARIIAQAEHLISVTGAGISTPSGIADFRSPDSGLWTSVDPMEVASIYGFRQRPASFFEWIRPHINTMLEAKPNPAHKALADLEALGCLKATITQNIDGLHQRAGSRHVLELHGHFREATCVRCYRVEALEEFLPDFLENGQVPRCPSCGGVLKPNAILFGEQLPISILNAAWREIRACDVVLVAGTSLQVLPVSDMPRRAVMRGAKAIIVNYQLTDLDPIAHVVLHQDVAVVLPQIAELCRRQIE